MAKNNPAQRYIRTLESEQSRTAMTSLLNNVARYFDSEKTLAELDWSILSADSVYKLRDRMRVSVTPTTPAHSDWPVINQVDA